MTAAPSRDRAGQDANHLRTLFVEIAAWGWSSHMAAKRLKWGRPATSTFFQRCRRRGWVEHDGAWRITDAGRAYLAAQTGER